MTTKPRVSLVTFDVGGTLVQPFRSIGTVYSEVLSGKGFPASPERTEVAFQEAWDEMARNIPPNRERYAWSPRGERGYWEAILAQTVGRLGGTEPPKGAAEELFEKFGHRDAWRLYPEVSETLEALAERGVPMGIVSNWDSRLPGLLRELGIRHHFGPILVSALEGYEKPDPRLFLLAAERAKVRPQEILHVGDRSLEDGEGARNAGCRALLVERNGSNGRGLGAVLDYVHERGGPAVGAGPS